MARLMIYLADLPATYPEKSVRDDRVRWPSPIRSTLQKLFNEVVKEPAAKKAGYDTAKVEWSSQSPNLGPHGLLVYFVRSTSDSVIKSGMNYPYSIASGAAGYTIFNKGSHLTGSEVYLRGIQDDGVGLGKVAFHELMHNMAQKNGHDLHRYKHNGKGVSLGADYITADTPLNATDKYLMATRLKTKRIQWTGGYSHYIDPSNPRL